MPFSSLLHLFRHANARKADIARTLAADSKRSVWALTDQGIVSFGNFGISILLARFFRDRAGDLGDFYTLMDLVIFLNTLQAALIVYPLTVRGAASDERTLARMTTLSLMLTFVGSPVFALGLIATALIAKISIWIGIWSVIALLLWQLQETTRRSMMAHLRFNEVIWGDLVSNVGQIICIAALAWMQKLTVIATFQAMALTSGIAALIQASQIRLGRSQPGELRSHIRECWNLGRWMIAGNLTNFVLGPLYTWNMRYWVGDVLLGVNQAVTNPLRLSNPLSFAIASLITPNAARINQSEGMHRARRVMLRFGALGGILLAPFLLVLVLFPRYAIALLYGWGAHDYLAWAPVLQIATIAAGFTFASTVTGAFLNGVQRSRDATFSQVAYAITALLVAMPLCAKFGLIGATFGWLVATIVQLLINLYYVKKMPPETAPTLSPQPQPEAEPRAADSPAIVPAVIG